jgi:tRNA pseudouridine38-40 synthase
MILILVSVPDSGHYRYSLCTRPLRSAESMPGQYHVFSTCSRCKRQANGYWASRDFRAFCHAGADVNHYRCRVTAADWLTAGDQLYFVIRANRFLHNMVRIIVGNMRRDWQGPMAAGRYGLIIASGTAVRQGRRRRPTV